MAEYRGNDAILTVAAVGGGIIGNCWVAAFLGNSLGVPLYNPMLEAGERTRSHVADTWQQMVELGLAWKGDDWTARRSVHDRLADALDGADFV